MMVKKFLIVLLSLIVVVLVVDVVYIGVVLFSSEKTPTLDSNPNNTVNLYNPYETQPVTTPQVPLGSPYNPQTSMPVQIPQTTTQAYADIPYLPENTTQNTTVPQEQVTKPPVQQNGAYTLQQTINEMQTAVAYVKSAKNFTGVKEQIPTLKIEELSMGFLLQPAQFIVNRFVDPVTKTYVFTNGFAYDEDKQMNVTPAAAIPPTDSAFRIEPSSVTSYNVTENADGGKTYTVTIMEEQCTIASPVPRYHAMCMDYVDLNDYDISPAKINSGDIFYHEATVSVTVNKDGIPVMLRQYMPVSGKGEGSLSGFTATGRVTGSLDERWTFTW